MEENLENKYPIDTPMPGTEQTQIRAVFGKLLYSAKDSDWAVSLYTAGDMMFRVSGEGLPRNKVTVVLIGKWTVYRKEPSFSVSSFYVEPPNTKKTICAFLQSLHCGIGKTGAEALYDAFGGETVRFCADHPDHVKEYARRVNVEKLKQELAATVIVRDLLKMLSEYTELKLELVRKVADRYGSNAVKIIRENPYRLMQIHGIGFSKADEIAMAMGGKPLSRNRVLAAIWFELTADCTANGHLYWPKDELFRRVTKLLVDVGAGAHIRALPKAEWDKYLEACLDQYIRQHKVYDDDGAVYGQPSWDQERDLALRLAVLSTAVPYSPGKGELDRYIATFEAEYEITLASRQRAAVYNAIERPLSIITGGAGTGKTTVVKCILYVLQRITEEEDDRNADLWLMAPTGRAAKRMTEVTGRPATTVHKAIGLCYDDDGVCAVHGDDTIEADAIIVDEASMVDEFLAFQLTQKVEFGTRLIFIGDPDQLPSVGAGNVLKELISSRCIPTTRLDVIFRQGELSPIVSNSLAINRGEKDLKWCKEFAKRTIADPEELVQKVVDYYLRCVNALGIENVLLLDPCRKVGNVTVGRFNAEIQARINPKRDGEDTMRVDGTEFRIRDRVMQTRNQDDGIANGDIGTITDFTMRLDEDSGLKRLYAVIQFDGQEVNYDSSHMKTVQLAYCTTVHKAQGAEAESVILVMRKEHKTMHQRNLLYTGVTRAKKYMVVFGDTDCINVCIDNNTAVRRNTKLSSTFRKFWVQQMRMEGRLPAEEERSEMKNAV